jgi:biopolymer transport protein ExbD
MSGSVHSSDRAEPNLTPILDMVFQLITFFMLVVNFKAAETDQSLKLPVIGSAKPSESKSQGELLVLNINADGKLRVRGRDEASIEGFVKAESDFLKRSVKNHADGDEWPITVVVRADGKTEVGLLMRVVRACQSQGFRKFDFMVMRQAAG